MSEEVKQNNEESTKDKILSINMPMDIFEELERRREAQEYKVSRAAYIVGLVRRALEM